MHVGTLRRGFEGGPRDTKAGNSRNVIMHVRALGKGSEKGSKSGGQQGSRAAGQYGSKAAGQQGSNVAGEQGSRAAG